MMIMGMPAGTFAIVALAVVALLLLALIPARVAQGKGYSLGGFYALGVFLWPVALIIALVVPDRAPHGRHSMK